MYMRSAGLRSHHNTIAGLLIRLPPLLGMLKQADKHSVLTWEIGRPVAYRFDNRPDNMAQRFGDSISLTGCQHTEVMRGGVLHIPEL